MDTNIEKDAIDRIFDGLTAAGYIAPSEGEDDGGFTLEGIVALYTMLELAVDARKGSTDGQTLERAARVMLPSAAAAAQLIKRGVSTEDVLNSPGFDEAWASTE